MALVVCVEPPPHAVSATAATAMPAKKELRRFTLGYISVSVGKFGGFSCMKYDCERSEGMVLNFSGA